MTQHEQLHADFLRALSRVRSLADNGDIEALSLIRTWHGHTKVWEGENFDNDVVYKILNYADSGYLLGDKYQSVHRNIKTLETVHLWLGGNGYILTGDLVHNKNHMSLYLTHWLCEQLNLEGDEYLFSEWDVAEEWVLGDWSFTPDEVTQIEKVFEWLRTLDEIPW